MTNSVPFRFTLIGVAGIALGGVASITLWRLPLQERPVLAGRAECPHDWPFKRAQMAEIGSNLNVPEFNDCQRFIEVRGDSSEYLALFAIFAAESLSMIHQAATGGGSPDIASYVSPAGRVVAKIYAEGRYAPLGINPPMNCLMLRRAGPDSIEAWVVPLDSVSVPCPKHADSARAMGGRRLKLTIRRIDGYEAGDYPPVARWDWDWDNDKQFLGFGCAAGWCEVSDNDYDPRTRLGSGDRTRDIKGWYDQQLLAYFPTPDRLAPSRVVGTIYPSHGRDRLGGQYAGRWVEVARVALEVLPGTNPTIAAMVATQYKEQFNYDLAASPNDLNIIELCRGRPAYIAAALPGRCVITTPPLAQASWLTDTQQRLNACVTDGDWWARVRPARGGPAEYYCINRRSGANVFGQNAARQLPPTSRWRWMAIDEGTWNECDAGCCEKLGPGG